MIHLKDFATISGAFEHSRRKLEHLQLEISGVLGPVKEHVAVFAVGSYGRLEAHPEVSDYEWITVFDDHLVSIHEAGACQARLAEYFAYVFGRSSLSINKTFGEVATLANLCANVGGEADSNRTLTYRMLVLAEGTPLIRNAAYGAIINGLATTYGSAGTAGHRLLSLATDIARYWRTLRIDYKHKVDEKRLPWAVRNLKLRSARRLWYFSLALDFLARAPRIAYERARSFDVAAVRDYLEGMAGSPVHRLVTACRVLNVPDPAVATLLQHYEAVQSALASRSVRKHLDALPNEQRFDDAIYEPIRAACATLHTQAAQVAVDLPPDKRLQLLEMFLL